DSARAPDRRAMRRSAVKVLPNRGLRIGCPSPLVGRSAPTAPYLTTAKRPPRRYVGGHPGRVSAEDQMPESVGHVVVGRLAGGQGSVGLGRRDDPPEVLVAHLALGVGDLL